MNLFAVVAFFSIIVGALLGIWQGARHGFAAAFRGAGGGALRGFGAYALLMFMMMTLLALGLWYRPPFPRCRHRKCRPQDFRYLYLDTRPPEPDRTLQEQADGLLAKCRCGTRYLVSRSERRLWEVTADGDLLPYMRYRPFGRWQSDPRPKWRTPSADQ
jgi:hypothetical protein